MGKPGTLSLEDDRIISEHVENPTVAKILYAQDIILKHQGSELKILVEAKEIRKQQRMSYEFIKGKATLINEKFQFNGKIVS